MPIERMAPIEVVDYHTAGEPFRIVLAGGPEIPGSSVLARRVAAPGIEAAEAARRLLVNEPRGHADMYGCFLVPPDDAGADLGVLFWHKDGYSTACGHGTIALARWAVDSGRVAATPDGTTPVTIDVPSGRVLAQVECEGGSVRHITFENVPAYVIGRDIELTTSWGAVRADVSWGGALYASVRAADLGLAVTPEHYAELIAAGRAVKAALAGHAAARHPSDPRLDGIYGTILFDELPPADGDGPVDLRQRNVTVFADGEVDRSPCGSGTSARLALLADSGVLVAGGVLHHGSIVGTQFAGRVIGEVESEGRAAYRTTVTGMAYETGRAAFTLDPADPLRAGFALR